MKPITVTVLGETWDPQLPPSFAIRQEVILATQRSDVRGYSAALGVCWGHSEQGPGVSYAGCGYDPLKYGGDVFDALVDLGVPPEVVYKEGIKCAAAMARSFPTQSAVEEKQSFTEASPDDDKPPARDAAR